MLEWAFSCNEFREYVLTFCELPVDAQRSLIRAKGVQLSRLLFCMDRLPSASVFKLALIQFKTGTKEPEYKRIVTDLYKNLNSMHVGNGRAICVQFAQIIPFVFKDRLYSCMSNFACTMAAADSTIDKEDLP